MKPPSFRRLWPLLLLALLPVQARATDPPPTDTPPPADTKEQTIYIPFNQLEEVFEKEDRGVFLPYRELLEMWNKLNLPAKLKPDKPPVDAALAAAHYTGAVAGDVAKIDAKLSFEALKQGWSSLKIGAPGLAVADAKTAAILSAGPEGYEVLFPDKGVYTVDATIYGGVTKDAGRSTLDLPLPKTAASQFELLIPDKALDFAIEPASAYSAVETPDGATRLLVYFGGSERVKIAWTKKASETALKPLLFVAANATVHIRPGAVQSDVNLAYQILRTGVDSFDLQVPAGGQVLSVDGENIREWNVQPPPAPGQPQTVHVALHTPARESYALHLGLELPLGALPQTVAFPEIKALQTERQTGSITIFAAPELVTDAVDLHELTQQPGLDQASNPRDQEGVLIARYRYLRLPYSGALKVSEAKPLVELESETLVAVQPDSLTLRAKFDATVKRAGIFGLEIDLPAGFTHADAEGAIIESAEVRTAGNRATLQINLKQLTQGEFSFIVKSDALRDKPESPLTVPLFSPHADRHEAKVGLAIHVSLKANTTDKGDLHEEDISNFTPLAPASWADGLTPNPAQTPLTLGFHYRAGAKPAQVQFELRKPRVSAEVLTLLSVREALLRHDWTIAYNIEYAGVNELSIEASKEIADDIQIEGDNIKERIRADKKDAQGQPTGPAVWKVTLQERVLGPYNLRLSHETPRGDQKPGTAAAVALHEIRPLDVFRETGQIAVVKDGNVELVKSTPQGLEPIDPKELNPILQTNGVFLAWKYAAHPIGLQLDVTKNLYLPVPRAVITYAVLNTVISEDEAETTEAVYWVRNNAQQFFSVELPSGKAPAKLLSDAFVDGEPQQPSRRPGRNELLIRLPAQEQSAEFSVRFVYEVPSPHPGEKLRWRGSLDLNPPRLTDVETLQAKWTLYLPSEHRYVSFASAMREPVGEHGWTLFRRALDLFIPQIGPVASIYGGTAQSEPAALPAAKSTGFDTQLHKEGVPVTLRRLGAPAEIRVNYRGKTYAAVLEALACLLAFAGGIGLLLHPRVQRLRYFFIVGLGALIIAGAVDPRAAGVWQAIYLGVLLCLPFWLAAGILETLRGLRSRRRAAAAPSPASTNPPPASPFPSSPANPGPIRVPIPPSSPANPPEPESSTTSEPAPTPSPISFSDTLRAAKVPATDPTAPTPPTPPEPPAPPPQPPTEPPRQERRKKGGGGPSPSTRENPKKPTPPAGE